MTQKISLEERITFLFVLSVILPLIPCAYIINDLQLDLLESSTLLLAFLIPAIWIFYRCFKTITDVLDRIGLQLDSLGNEEYNSWHLAGFNEGRIKTLKRDFVKLGKKLSEKRFEYMHNESFLFEFIKDLELPILVLDHHQQVYSVNNSFTTVLDTSKNDTSKNDKEHDDVTHFIGTKVSSLGINFIDNKWQQAQNSALNKRYEITHHVLIRSGRPYQLLVLFSIEQQLRENEKQVWQRLIRVLNHEVRNSLTPIYSMSQSLQEMKLTGPLTPEQEKLEANILQVIEKRALQLLEFVESYGAFSQLAPAKTELVVSDDINQRIQAIFPKLTIEAVESYPLQADIGQLEQTLINLIKNAFEASTENAPVLLKWSQNSIETNIEILDAGVGIVNADNLFVPFYSTKEEGTGIGLILSREFIRNQGGELTLKNRNEAQGAVAKISFPK